MSVGFFERVRELIVERDTTLVLGVDPHPEDLREESARALAKWCEDLIAKAGPYAVAIKPNSAFFERVPGGMEVLASLIESSSLPVLLDVKRGDIGSTAKGYADAAYDRLGADAVTVQPFLGEDSVRPFLREGKGVFVLCRTSNASSDWIQDGPGEPLFEQVAKRFLSCGSDVGLVVGATKPAALRRLREQYPTAWFLCPGVGAQGADAADTMNNGATEDGFGMLVPVSRGISRADDPAAEAQRLAKALAPVQRGRVERPDEALQAMVDLDCVRFGSFTLRSGAVSPVYVDCRRVIGSPRLMRELARRMAVRMVGEDRVAGVPSAGVPLGTAVSLESGVPLIYNRSAAKAHGMGQQVEGIYEEGDRVLLVDDVATSGISLLEAAGILRAHGLVVERASVVIDREDGARQALAKAGIRLEALFTLSDLVAARP